MSENKNKIEKIFAHDVKRYVLLCNELLTRLKNKSGEEEILLSQLESALLKISILTDAVLISSKADDGNLRVSPLSVDLNHLIADVASGLKPLSGNVEVKCSLNELPHIQLDPSLFPLVLENLIENAVKYSVDGKPVEIETRANSKFIELSVSNYGIGVPDADKEKMFGKYFRASNALTLSGHGLGLYIAKKIVELHRGSLTFESTKDGFTRFIITLPLT